MAAVECSGVYEGYMCYGYLDLPIHDVDGMVQDMMAAVEASGAYEGHAEFTAPKGDSKGKLVSNCRTLRTLGWRPKYGETGGCCGCRNSCSARLTARGCCTCMAGCRLLPASRSVALSLALSMHMWDEHPAAAARPSCTLLPGISLMHCSWSAAGSFEEFMAAGGKDWFSEEQGSVVQGSAPS
jgi:hypothetical protein